MNTTVKNWRATRLRERRTLTRIEHRLQTDTGLSMAAFDILLEVEPNPVGMKELAETVGLSPSGLTRAVDTLADVGLVERRRVPGDRRMAQLAISERGKRKLLREEGLYEQAVLAFIR